MVLLVCVSVVDVIFCNVLGTLVDGFSSIYYCDEMVMGIGDL